MPRGTLALCSALLISLHALSGAWAFQCGPSVNCAPPAIPVCGPPVVPLSVCCEPSPLFPPAPPLVAPVIVGPAPGCCAGPVPVVLDTPPPVASKVSAYRAQPMDLAPVTGAAVNQAPRRLPAERTVDTNGRPGL
jgi:hypothetical protein